MENKQEDIFDTIGKFMNENPIYIGPFIMAMGGLLLYAAIVDADWVYGGRPSYNTDKVEGMVTMYGRKTTRVITGIGAVGVIISGLSILIIYSN